MRPLIFTIAEEHYLKTVILIDPLGFLSVVAPYLLTDLPPKKELEVTPLSGVFWNDDNDEVHADCVILFQRRKDLVDCLPLIHVEFEHAFSTWLGERIAPCRKAMERYYRDRQRKVVTVALVLRGDRAGFVIEERPFRWMRFGLAGCDAQEYLERSEPVAWALAARMDPGDWSPLEHKLACFRRLDAADGLSDNLREFMENWLDVAMPLPEEQDRELARLLEADGSVGLANRDIPRWAWA